jgi:uncharacterized membrane protein SpoIIM required for sporulation
MQEGKKKRMTIGLIPIVILFFNQFMIGQRTAYTRGTSGNSLSSRRTPSL